EPASLGAPLEARRDERPRRDEVRGEARDEAAAGCAGLDRRAAAPGCDERARRPRRAAAAGAAPGEEAAPREEAAGRDGEGRAVARPGAGASEEVARPLRHEPQPGR